MNTSLPCKLPYLQRKKFELYLKQFRSTILILQCCISLALESPMDWVSELPLTHKIIVDVQGAGKSEEANLSTDCFM